jgi:hypothetical protein
MIAFLRQRSISLSTVVLVLGIILLLQGGISFSTSFGRLSVFVPEIHQSGLSGFWLAFRGILILTILGLWIANRKRPLFRAIIVVNGIFTFGLFVNMTALVAVLFGVSAQDVAALLVDVVLMAISNILIFSIWYWIIDPPGVTDDQRDYEPWDFLFPQRSNTVPHYEDWQPRYTDYLYLAFTTSFAFSPTDTLPLTRRAKLLMLLQSVISIVTLTAVAGSAINILASAD